MSGDQNYHSIIERSRQMTIVGAVVSVISLVCSCLIFLSASTDGWQGVSGFVLGGVPFVISLIFSVAAIICAMFQKNAAEQAEEQSLLERRKGVQSAFDIEEEIRYSGRKSLANFVKFGGYVISILGAIVIVVALFQIDSRWSDFLEEPVAVRDTMPLLVIAVILLFVATFTGAFCLGQSREGESRWLRPVGGWLIVGAIINLLTVLATAFANSDNFALINSITSNISFWLLALLGIELIAGAVMEFYRPRTVVLERPLFESRVLSLFTESGGVMRNIENTLDYQFGFKISQTSLYAFFERSLTSFVLAWLAALWIFTVFAQVAPGELGLRERFGKVDTAATVEPGVHFKLPWPFERINRISVSKVHEVIIGGRGDKRPETVLWSKEHYDTTVQFLVGAETESEQMDEDDSNASPVSFLNVRIPIHYQVRGDKKSVYNYLYGHADSGKALQNIGEFVVTRYCASADVIDIMSTGRGRAVAELKTQIQTKADELELGVDIVAVNLHDVHPPVGGDEEETLSVAVAFQNVIAAQEEKRTEELKAEVYERTTLPEAETQAVKLINAAEAYQVRVLTVGEAESERFLKQMEAYRASPELFELRSRLAIIENLPESVRKYVVSDSLKSETFEIDLQEKSRMDILDVNLGDLQ